MTSGRETLRGALRSGRALIAFACCAALYGLEAEALPVSSETNDMRHLSESGYLPPDDLGSEAIGSERMVSLLNAILHPGDDVRGNSLDSEMVRAMNLPEGFLEGTVAPNTIGRTKRYVLKGSKWDKKNLTYRITKYTSQLSRAEVDETIAKAFGVWSRYTDLKFSTGAGEVDIEIRFERGDHGDGSPFSGSSDKNTGHGFYPGNGGDIHFNDDRKWTIIRNDDYNLFSQATVLIGFSLGLGKSNATSSVMNHRFVMYDPNPPLPDDDIAGIQALYGPKTVQNVSDVCGDSRLDAMFKSTEGYVYIFEGQYYWKFADGVFTPGYPKLIAETWYGLPDDIDAAFTTELGETYFFKGSTYWKYLGKQLVADWPRKFDELGTSDKDLWEALIENQRHLLSFKLNFLCFSKEVPVLLS